MIIADINSLAPYKTMSKNMQLALEFLKGVDLESLEDGKYPVIDNDIFIVVSTYPTREHSECKYEIHHNYIDIQCLISGEELIFCNEASRLEAYGEYNPATDKLNFKDQLGEVSIHLKPGMAAIFYPNDAHKACCRLGHESKQVRKLLVKVKL